MPMHLRELDQRENALAYHEAQLARREAFADQRNQIADRRARIPVGEGTAMGRELSDCNANTIGPSG